MMLLYAGVNRYGTHFSGQTSGSPAAFVEAKYRARWQYLTVTNDGEVVGEIHDHTDDGRRIWWAEDVEVNER